ncbi:MAG: NADH-quinone oxidoreductase subunit N [Fimbriiglobus sp.]
MLIHQEFLTNAYKFILPELALVGTACLLFVLAFLKPQRSIATVLALAGVAGAAVLAAIVSWPQFQSVFGWQEVSYFWSLVEGTSIYPRAYSPFDPTGPAAFVRWIAIAAVALFVLLAYSETTDNNCCEYLACTLVVAAGLSLVARANDLVSFFLALEMISIPTYILLYLPARTKLGQESAIKYFLLSILSSGVLLFGFSYLYGLTGTTNLGAMIDSLNDAHKVQVNPLALMAIVLVIAGLSFRLAAVPFHWYAPDVYQGAPTGVVAQLAFVPKVAGVIALARILGMLYPPINQLPFDANSTLIPFLLWLIAAVTMTVGNIFALLQTNLKRMLAYSGIAHGGYMLIGFVVASMLPETQSGASLYQIGLDSVLFYLVAYGLMSIGVFAVMIYLGGGDSPVESIDDLAGLAKTHPMAAGTLAVFLCSLIGLPMTAGFIGKFLLFIGAFNIPTPSNMKMMPQILAVIAAVNAAIAAVYYLRVLSAMYLRTPLRTAETNPSKLALLVALICAVGTLGLGVYPKPLADLTRSVVPYTDDTPKAK